MKYLTFLPALILALFLIFSCRRKQTESTNKKQDKVSFLLDALKDTGSTYVMIAAHRGDWYFAPENSIQGFQNCIDMGVDIIEVDVRLSKDGVPVIVHDLTLDRTTNGTGKVEDWTLDSLKTLYLKTPLNVVSTHRIPTLEEVLVMAKGKILVYLDKATDKVASVLPVLERTGTLDHAVFVVNYSLDQAKQEFGDKLDKVICVPVVSDDRDSLTAYIRDYSTHLKPYAFQFRMSNDTSPAYRHLEMVKERGAHIFVAATWSEHSLGHDDHASRLSPDQGWGWLIDQGVSIIETDRPYMLIDYLKERGLR